MQESTFSAERPIETLAEDQLGRRDFASAVAKVISQRRDRDSLVLAIYGPWGSGKSSLKNMILDSLDKQNAKTIPLEFNPWEWEGQEKVFEGFFNELSAKLGSSDKSKEGAKTAKIMRKYGTMLSAAAHITVGLRSLLVTLLLAIGFFGFAPSFIRNQNLLLLLKILSGVALAAAAILGWFSTAADKLSAFWGAKSEADYKGIAEVKKELAALLHALPHNVLVVIDDIDRLTPDGIRMIFQLVKANADFPNLIYLLLFQREIAECALSRGGTVDGSQFLDKVVQVGFDIPRLASLKLEETLESAIRGVIQGTPADAKFDSERWGDLFLSAIRPYFRTLRDVKRFGNALSFHFELYRNNETFDANPVDLIALESLRQFEPTLYQKLYGAANVLTGRSVLGFDLPQAHKKEIEFLFENSNRPDAARKIVENLFPPAAVALAESGVTSRSTFTQEWLKKLRVCHPDMFERYFRFSLSDEELSEAELASLIAVTGDRVKLVAELKELNRKQLLRATLDRLGIDGASIIPSQNIVSFIVGIFDIEREICIQETNRGRTQVLPEQRAIFIIHSILQSKTQGERGRILKESVEQTTGLYLPIMSFEWPKNRQESFLDSTISEQDTQELQELCINKIKAEAQTSLLLSHPRLQSILRVWSQWGTVEDAPSWFKSTITADSDLLTLLGAFTGRMAHIDGERTTKITYKFEIEKFALYINPEEIEDRIRQLASSSDSDSRIRCQLYLKALKDWKNGDKGSGLPPDLRGWTTIEDLSD